MATSKITGVLDNASVDMIQPQQNGKQLYIPYVDASGNLKIKKLTETTAAIATSCVAT
jgi:hypothetical protein